MSTEKAIASYIANGRVPWSPGYSACKTNLIAETLSDEKVMARFRENLSLPDGYGINMDERVVEYPWVFAHLDPRSDLVLDAGSTFSKDFLLKGVLKDRKIIIYTLETDWIALNRNVSYIFGDFRTMLLRDHCVDAISCISTLEHVGMGQDYKKYSMENPWPEQDPLAYRGALREFRRILKPGGQLLLTVPFGKRENHGWLQQFDDGSLRDVVGSFDGELVRKSFFLYLPSGWTVASAADCSSASYYNIHAASGFDPDGAAAARAVACLEFRC